MFASPFNKAIGEGYPWGGGGGGELSLRLRAKTRIFCNKPAIKNDGLNFLTV